MSSVEKDGTPISSRMPSALDKQIGGDHYKTEKLQPLEVTYQNFGYDGLSASIYTKVLKYLRRNKGNHIENLEKAKHCIEMQIEFALRDQRVPPTAPESWQDGAPEPEYGPSEVPERRLRYD